MAWVLLLLALLVGPVLWAVTLGRRRPSPEEDRRGMSGYGDLIKGVAERDWTGPGTGV
ncbi:MAG TPA: hypothetical protein VFM06_04800 [Candidatus Limnocylindria bacterium]|nr:hypothetical protein [Candidatus Limnocylindria bacterium]